ncbi:MAG: hypothetical protein C0397_09835 [Odoribacter sp.]|nr:hypothetical protein [Odoribacter sp.]
MKNDIMQPKTFNARYMSFEEVASSFIKPEGFDEICRNDHTILTGSRGCGKTTLLKMLHPKALYNWKGIDAEDVKNRIPFIGIYIPSDAQWSYQIKVIKKQLTKNSVFGDNLFSGVVNANVLVAICSTFSALIEMLKLDQNFEVDLSIELIENWNIPKPVSPNLASITLKLTTMVNNFNIFVRKKKYEVDLPDICYSDFINLVSIGIMIFENQANKLKLDFFKKDYKWALCFDELEIAPEWLKHKLINSDLRSRDQKILFKLTSTPGLDELRNKSDITRPSKYEDFNVHKLWVHDKKSQNDWHIFCAKYVKSHLSKSSKAIKDLKSIFGIHSFDDALKQSENVFATCKTKNDTQFYEDGLVWKAMKLLAEFDKSFYRFLLRKQMDPSNPIPINRNQLNSVHRKIKQIVYYRYYFTEQSLQDNSIKLRSRNVNLFNHGLDFIFDIADGNPRAFVILINSFEKVIDSNQELPIKISIQARIIDKFTSDFFYPRIENYPRNIINYKSKIFTLIEIVNCIGNYFFQRLVLESFSADPVIFFYMDNNCPIEFKAFIDIALESGAILNVEDEIAIKGVRKNTSVYRLSYALYPIYKLPQRDYKIIGLSNIIAPLIDKNRKNIDNNQIEIDFHHGN